MPLPATAGSWDCKCATTPGLQGTGVQPQGSVHVSPLSYILTPLTSSLRGRFFVFCFCFLLETVKFKLSCLSLGHFLALTSNPVVSARNNIQTGFVQCVWVSVGPPSALFPAQPRSLHHHFPRPANRTHS